MSLTPLLDAALVVQVHAFAAMTAFGFGVVQLAAPKGTLPHRSLGWVWIVLMVAIAGSSFWIHDLKIIGSFSPIHALSIYTLAMLPLAVMHARRGRIGKHRSAMISIFVGALIIAGVFTFLPGRVMHTVAFGN
jgi:uncharacterized membrane protein